MVSEDDFLASMVAIKRYVTLWEMTNLDLIRDGLYQIEEVRMENQNQNLNGGFNNAYAAFVEKPGAETLLPALEKATAALYTPKPNAAGVIEQFDGYFTLEDTTVEAVRSRLKDPREYWGGAYGVASQTKVIKQADVITMLELCHKDYGADILKANWDYYCPRTEHGSSLSACMYALVACRWGGAEEALPFFLKSARADWDGGGKQWAGLVYIGGTHPAASGGAWKVFAQGFAGLETEAGKPVLHPQLPKNGSVSALPVR